MNEPDGRPELRLPADFDELWDVPAKGWFAAELVSLGRTYAVTSMIPCVWPRRSRTNLRGAGFSLRRT
jgi:hypothetical protein